MTVSFLIFVALFGASLICAVLYGYRRGYCDGQKQMQDGKQN